MEVFSFKAFLYFYGMILNNTNQLIHQARSIVSLVPSQTELLFYFGLHAETIGITKFCIHPPQWHRNKFKVGGTKTVDIQKIINLNPDLIIANKEENVKEQVETLATHFPVWITDVNNLDDAISMIADIGQLTNKETAAWQLIDQIKINFSQLNNPPIQSSIPNSLLTACYLIWKDPFMTIGSDTFINDMMQQAGFKNIFETKTRYPQVTLNDIEAARCKFIFLSSEPYPFKQKHLEELQQQLPGMKIILVDGEMFSWYGSRLLQAPGYFKKLMAQAIVGK